VSSEYLSGSRDRRGVQAHSRRSPSVPKTFPIRSPAVRERGLRRLDREESGSGGSLPLRDKSTAPHAFSSFPCAGPCLLLRSPLLSLLPLAPSYLPQFLPPLPSSHQISPLRTPSPSLAPFSSSHNVSFVCLQSGGSLVGCSRAGFVARGGFRALGASS
jgi:hypothetical protein